MLEAPNRHAMLRARHRQAIVNAARDLMVEHGGVGFSADQLAERADVSRRTVFNHFASMDDVVTAASTEVLAGILDELECTTVDQATGTGRDAMLDELAAALRATDLVTPIVQLTRLLGGDPPDPGPRAAVLFMRAFGEVSARLSRAMRASHPAEDPLDVDLLVSSLVGGLLAVQRAWADRTGTTDTPESRAEWHRLLDRLIDSLRHPRGTTRG